MNVFVFGGSTTFGYAVSSSNTLPVELQRELQSLFTNRQVQCYNFGCGGYFSTQERLRFEQLLTAGHVPKLAIFVDGLNDFTFWKGLPMFSEHVARLFSPEHRLPPMGLVPPAQTEIEGELRAASLLDKREDDRGRCGPMVGSDLVHRPAGSIL